MSMFHQSSVEPISDNMIGARAKLILKQAKPVSKASMRKPASDIFSQSKSNSSLPVAEIADPVQSPLPPIVPDHPPPSPPAALLPQPVSHPSLLMSTLHRKPSEESNFSEEGSENSGISGIEGLENSEDEGQNLNKGFAESPTSPSSTPSPRPRPTIPVQIVRADSLESNFLRRTTSGGIRATPKRAVNQKGKYNLVAGANKKLDKIENLGEFKTKYKANERTKHLIEKHGKEAAENLLKLNNSKVDGLDEKENGFVLIYKSGEKSFIVSEGHMGRRMIESEVYRNYMFEHAKKVEVNLKTKMLTSILKGQYGKSKGVSTPEAHKRKTYRGIGGQKKQPKRKELQKIHLMIKKLGPLMQPKINMSRRKLIRDGMKKNQQMMRKI